VTFTVSAWTAHPSAEPGTAPGHPSSDFGSNITRLGYRSSLPGGGMSRPLLWISCCFRRS